MSFNIDVAFDHIRVNVISWILRFGPQIGFIVHIISLTQCSAVYGR
jgi:hypothetical protein